MSAGGLFLAIVCCDYDGFRLVCHDSIGCCLGLIDHGSASWSIFEAGRGRGE